MHRLISFAVFSICFAAHASLLFVGASATREPANNSLIKQKNSMSGDFLLTFTGGTGQGFFVPILQLSGSTNDSTGNFTLLGATASISGFRNVDSPGLVAGDPTTSAGMSPYPVGLDCSPSGLGVPGQCLIPFTYGQSQEVHLTAEVVEEIEVNPYVPPDPAFASVSGIAEFDGISIYNAPLGALAMIRPIPEPSLVVPIGIGLAVLVLWRRTSRLLCRKRLH